MKTYMRLRIFIKTILSTLFILVLFPLSGFSALYSESEPHFQKDHLNSQKQTQVAIIHPQEDGRPCGLIVDVNSPLVPLPIREAAQNSQNFLKSEKTLEELFTEHGISECNSEDIARIFILAQITSEEEELVMSENPVRIAMGPGMALMRVIEAARYAGPTIKRARVPISKAMQKAKDFWIILRDTPYKQWRDITLISSCIGGTVGGAMGYHRVSQMRNKIAQGQATGQTQGQLLLELKETKTTSSSEKLLMNTSARAQEYAYTAEVMSIIGASLGSLNDGGSLYFLGIFSKLFCGVGSYFILSTSYSL